MSQNKFWDDPDIQGWLTSVTADMIPKMKASAISLAIFSGTVDAKLAVEMASWPAETLREYRGAHVLYVGEGSGGCNANDAFFALLDAEFALHLELEIPQFEGLHDHLEIWRRHAAGTG